MLHLGRSALLDWPMLFNRLKIEAEQHQKDGSSICVNSAASPTDWPVGNTQNIPQKCMHFPLKLGHALAGRGCIAKLPCHYVVRPRMTNWTCKSSLRALFLKVSVMFSIFLNAVISLENHSDLTVLLPVVLTILAFSVPRLSLVIYHH